MNKYQLQTAIEELTKVYESIIKIPWQKLQNADKESNPMPAEELREDFIPITDLLRARNRLEMALKILEEKQSQKQQNDS